MKKIMAIVSVSLWIIGCTSSLHDIKNSPLIYNGKFKGDYIHLVRCVSKTMKQDNNSLTKLFQTTINVNTDIKTSEIQIFFSAQHTTSYAFEMTIKQEDTDMVLVELKGDKNESDLAWKTLNKCVKEKHP